MRNRHIQELPFYAYCVLRMEAHEEWSVFEGIDTRPVFPVREGRMAMLVSRLDADFLASAQNVVEHSQAIHRVFEAHTVLPFRFGTSFENEDQVRRVLLANRTKFQDAMNRLRNKAEMHVRVLFPGAAPGAWLETDGGLPEPERMFAKRARELVGKAFEPLEEHITVRPLRNGDWMVDFAHLIEQAEQPAYRRAFAAPAEQIQECQVVVSGPWPPYHFMPSAIRVPAGSERILRPGRRLVRRAATVQAPVAAPLTAHVAKA